ncbi:septum site-determining protein MinC [Saccharospirillum salsuginis]|uniref:Probable septum site-determining protein MinC n=1 Tax=Saccharospirillum salsuginis TaxID=418750 RepID=A0A918KND0_9GAMM|nr:septum site-determining protein MinC [Saccharospirillum salsuginis]GGX69494.1 putative septum site-determining protein MinC [Saccharospirillum salsuginis]
MTDAQPLTVRARMLPVQRLIVEDPDPDRFEQRLQATLAQAPALFNRAPVALDLTALVDNLSGDLLTHLLERCWRHPVIVFALAGPKESLGIWCDEFQLAWMDSRDRVTKPKSSQASPALDTQVITQPVRSGQQIYARGAHLLIMNQVSAGAEVIADGNIHVFGALRGRAMAGVQGLDSAEIVCQEMDADLVAIAGTYRVRDDMPEHSQGAARVYLRDEQLLIDHY